MDAILSVLQTAAMIFIVIMFFNLMIFVHELGHFLAGRWRGAYIDRFQIWFGNPIWQKTINGVQWGLGWIPAGGFVSLPQMGDMEDIEGEVDLPKDLKPLKPLDKVIIAAAGPLFSLLLAFFFAVVVWVVGKPTADISNQIGYVVPESPAAVAGLIPGDTITAIDAQPVYKWAGNMEGVSELLALSENSEIVLDINRPMADGSSKKMQITCSYELPDTSWWQRRAMRKIGIAPAFDAFVGDITANSPAAKAGLEKGDKIIAVNGNNVYSPSAVLIASKDAKPMTMTVERAGEQHAVNIQAVIPANWKERQEAYPILGFTWGAGENIVSMVHPNPFNQIALSVKWMGDMLAKVVSPGSDVGVEHLSGPVGIGNHLFKMLEAEDGWRFMLWFAVILNVNLAVLNILPLPVVDGGHVTRSLIEMIVGRPVGGVALEYIQRAFILLIMGFFIFVTFKDVGDMFGSSQPKTNELPVALFD